MTAGGAVVSVAEWLVGGWPRPVVRCPGVGTGGRVCLAQVFAGGVESGMVEPVWRCPGHVPGCDRARGGGEGLGAAGRWCLDGARGGERVGVPPEVVRAVVGSLGDAGLEEGVACVEASEVRWGLDWEVCDGEVAWRVGSDPGRWVTSTARGLAGDLGGAWDRHLGRLAGCREVCRRAAGLARLVGAGLGGRPVVVDAWGGSCEIGARLSSGRHVRVSVPGPEGPVGVRLDWGPWIEGLDEAACVDLVRSAS
nr:Uncharacterised protein [Actinomyces israelii]